jgi:hypothetical protein
MTKQNEAGKVWPQTMQGSDKAVHAPSPYEPRLRKIAEKCGSEIADALEQEECSRPLQVNDLSAVVLAVLRSELSGVLEAVDEVCSPISTLTMENRLYKLAEEAEKWKR